MRGAASLSGLVSGRPHRLLSALKSATLHPATVIVLLSVLVFGRALWPGRVLSPADILFSFHPWRALAPEAVPQNPLLSDQAFQFHPWLVYAAGEVWNGRFPLWNPHAYAGAPLLANAQSALLFPYAALAYVLPVPTALGLAAILKTATAGLSMYWLLRVLALQPLSALAGAVAFMFNGFLIVWLGWPLSNVGIWLPLLVGLTERLRQTGALRYIGWLAVAVGVQFLGGHPETSFHVLVITGCYALYRAPGPAWRRFLIQFSVAGILGGLLAAVQLLPFLEYLSHSSVLFYRGSDPHVFALPLRAVIALLIPNYFGNPASGNFWGPSNYNELSASAGVLPWILAPCALLGGWARSETKFFLGLGLLSGAVIYNTPPLLSQALSTLPGFSLAANHRLLLALAFSLAALSAIGMETILTSPLEGRGRLILGVKATFLVLLAVAAGYLVADHEEILFRSLTLSVAAQWGTFLVLLTAGTLIAIQALRLHGSLTLLGVGLVAVEFLSLLTFAPSYSPIIKTEAFYPSAPALNYLQRDRDLFRVLLPFSNVGAVYGLSDVAGYDAMTPRRLEQLMDAMQSVGGPGSAPLRFTEPLTSPLLDLLNVKYVLLPPGAGSPGPKFRLEYDGPDGRVYRNLEVLPRAFLVARARSCLDEGEALTLIRGGAIDFREEVVLGGCQQTSPPAAPVSRASVQVERYEPGHVIIQANAEAPAFLVLTDTYFPGWQVRVDRREVPILRANYAFRAVALEPGSHTVEFSYQPLTFRLGLGLSAAAMLGTAMLLVLGRRTYS